MTRTTSNSPSSEPPRSWARLVTWTVVAGLSLSGATAMAATSTQASADDADPPKKTFKVPKVKTKKKVPIPKIKKKKKIKLPTFKKKPSSGDSGGSTSSSVTMPEACTIRTSDLIHQKIDIGAQVSLMRKLSGDLHSRREASSIYTAIEDGRLAGVFLPPRKAVSDRGARMNPPKGYWQLIPQGKLSTCLKQPSAEPPMIVYRENLTKPQIDVALTQAWQECGLMELPEPCDYIVDLHKPEVECNTDQDCIDKNKGDFCNQQSHTCGVSFPDDHVPGPTCGYPSCDPSLSTDIYAACGTVNGVPVQCVAKAGSNCGVCENVSSASQQCHAANESKHAAANAKCAADYSPGKVAKYSAQCVKDMLKCADGSVLACGKAAKCFVSPETYNEYKECLDKESARYQKEGKRCSGL